VPIDDSRCREQSVSKERAISIRSPDGCQHPAEDPRNLPVRDLGKSMDFFSNLGFTFNPRFTDDKAACMVVSDEAFVMLLTEPSFKIRGR
jgi:Bleomycin resistance protein-like N-terminal